MSKAVQFRRGGAPMTTPNPSRRRLPSGAQGGIGNGGKFGYLKPIRRQEAAERQEVRDALSRAEQLLRLDRRLGKGVGAKKERARLGG